MTQVFSDWLRIDCLCPLDLTMLGERWKEETTDLLIHTDSSRLTKDGDYKGSFDVNVYIRNLQKSTILFFHSLTTT